MRGAEHHFRFVAGNQLRICHRVAADVPQRSRRRARVEADVRRGIEREREARHDRANRADGALVDERTIMARSTAHGDT